MSDIETKHIAGECRNFAPMTLMIILKSSLNEVIV